MAEMIEQAAPLIHAPPAPGVVSEEADPVAPAAEVAEEAEPTAEQKPKGNGFQKRISKLTARNYELQDKLRNFDNRLRSLEHRGIEVVDDDEPDAREWARTRNAQQSAGVSLHLRERKELEAELGKVQSELQQHLPAEQGPLTPEGYAAGAAPLLDAAAWSMANQALPGAEVWKVLRKPEQVVLAWQGKDVPPAFGK